MVIYSPSITGSLSISSSGAFNNVGSANFTGSVFVTGSINVVGDITASNARFSNIITAQTLVVQVVSSSTEYASGSNVFGNLASNTQTFTGSVNITGSSHSIIGNTAITAGPGATLQLIKSSNSIPNITFTGANYDSYIDGGNYLAFGTSGSYRMYISASGNVGIGVTYPNSQLYIGGPSAQTSSALLDSGTRNGLVTILSGGGAAGNGGGIVLGVNTQNDATGYGQVAFKTLLVDGAGQGRSDLAISLRNATTDIALTERIRITSSGSVGIGTDTPVYGKLSIFDTDNSVTTSSMFGTSTGTGVTVAVYNGSQTANTSAGIRLITRNSGASIWNMANLSTGASTGDLVFGNGTGGSGTEKMRITNGGNVGIGTTSPGSILHVKGGTAGGADFGAELRVWENTFGAVLQGSTYGTTEAFLGNFRYNFNTAASSVTNYYQAGHGILFYDGVHLFSSQPGGTSGGTFTPVERLTITNSGNVGIGITTPYSKLDINNGNIRMGEFLNSASSYIGKQSAGNSNFYSSIQFYSTSGEDALIFNTHLSGVSAGERMRISGGGSVTIGGSLSKGSGTFRIDHPLESKKNTHQLVHSFIEGPRADLIYRGTTTLISGSAVINIDISAGMTEGTFIALNRETQFFITNQSGWNNIKGSLHGNILTIEAEDTNSTDTIAWMVVGERQDKHIKETDWTDSNGKPILEPAK